MIISLICHVSSVLTFKFMLLLLLSCQFPCLFSHNHTLWPHPAAQYFLTSQLPTPFGILFIAIAALLMINNI